MKKEKKTPIVFYMVLLSLIFVNVYTWGANIYQVINADYTTIEGLLIVRIIGIFVFPIGCILGWF